MTVDYPALDAEGRARWLDMTSRDNAEAMLAAAKDSPDGTVRHFGDNVWHVDEILAALDRKPPPYRLSDDPYAEIMLGERDPYADLTRREQFMERYGLSPTDVDDAA